MEFLRRLLLHVLPRGFHKIRHYGLCASQHVARGTLAALRDQLACEPHRSPEESCLQPQHITAQRAAAAAPASVLEAMLALTGIDVLRCPRCAYGRLVPMPLPTPAPVYQDSS